MYYETEVNKSVFNNYKGGWWGGGVHIDSGLLSFKNLDATNTIELYIMSSDQYLVCLILNLFYSGNGCTYSSTFEMQTD